jgi:hypothetical protein
MATSTTVPITVTPEAAARVAELGLQRELDEMVKHTLETIPGLRAVNVVLVLPYDTGEEDRISIDATVDMNTPGLYEAQCQWGRWLIETYPSRVMAYINLMTTFGATP